ncbi:MAG: hypothetical protein WBG71_10230 [Leeuwenhoekiella sp.]
MLTFQNLSNSYAQANNTEAALYNIGISSIISGIGSVINKDKDEKLGKSLLNGMGKGALGGYIIFESKRILREVQRQQVLEYSWPSKITNAIGTSIVENGASNRGFFDQMNLNIGFLRLEVHAKEHFKVKPKIAPIELAFFIGAYSQSKFEPMLSLRTGQFIFSSATSRWEETNSNGIALPGIIVFKRSIQDQSRLTQIISHEIIHLYQHQDYNGFNAYLNKPLTRLSEKSPTFDALN